MTKRTCVLCKHFLFDAGHADYSDVTPGYDWSMECNIHLDRDGKRIILAEGEFLPSYWELRWYLSGHDVTEDQLRTTLLTAETCPDFEEVEG